jgi:glyoxylase-like metal-dependent hydrolase (beta-lactamase superfamily II)
MQKQTFPPRPKEAWPTRTIVRPETITFGATRIDVGPLPPAHTNGDLYVSLPQTNILIVSDALTVGRYPVPDYSTGGWINGTIDATTALLAVATADTRIIPGLGAVQARSDLQAEHDMLATVRDRVVMMLRQGKSLAEVKAAAPTREFDARWGDPGTFLESTYVGLLRHTHELGAIL